MGKIVISENVSLDGVVQDPTGEEGFTRGGWFDRMAGKDRLEWTKVEFDEALGTEALLLGRMELRVVRGEVAVPERRVGGAAERPAQVRRVLDPRRPRVEQLDGPHAARWSPRSRS